MSNEKTYKTCSQCGVQVPMGMFFCHKCRNDKFNTVEGLKIGAPNVQLFTFNPFGNGLETGAYENLGVVSAYMGLGVGPLTAIFSAWSNDFGVESKKYNEKMATATDACMLKIKNIAHELGADAVVGMQTTFTELTAGHGQILVCMIGTAVKKAWMDGGLRDGSN